MTHLPAVRAFEKALRSSAELQRQNEGAEADRLFDGGEFSDSFHADVAAEIEERICSAVAARFNMTTQDLHIAHLDRCEEQWDRFIQHG
jgi:hypothetical protein